MFAEIPPIQLTFELSTALTFGTAIGGALGTALTIIAKLLINLWVAQSATNKDMMDRYVEMLEKTITVLAKVPEALNAKPIGA